MEAVAADPIQIPRQTDGRFMPGWRNPKAPSRDMAAVRMKKGEGGRVAALNWLYSVTKEPMVANSIKAALRKEGKEHPLRYFKEILMPLFPKEMLMRVGAEKGGMTWASYLTSNLTTANSPSDGTDTSDSEPSAAGGAGERLCLPPPSCSTSPDKTAARISGLPRPTGSQSEE